MAGEINSKSFVVDTDERSERAKVHFEIQSQL